MKPADRSTTRPSRARDRFIPVLLPLSVLLGWWLCTSYGAVPEYMLPSPQTVGETFSQYLGLSESYDTSCGRLPQDMAASLWRVFCGCMLTIPAGLVLGLASGRSPRFAALLAPVVHGLRAVPGISWLPLALLWLGVGFQATVALISLAAFFPAYLNAAAASASVPKKLLRAGQMLGFHGWRLFWHVIVPHCMPGVLTGMRLALGMGFSYLVLGELTGVPDGLGAMIMDARLVGRVDLILCGIVVIAVTGWLCDVLLVRIVKAFSAGARLV